MCGDGLPVGVGPGLGIIQSHAAHPQAAKLLFSSQTNSRPAMSQDPRGTANEARERERELPTPSALPAFPLSLPSIGPPPWASMAHLGSFLPLQGARS